MMTSDAPHPHVPPLLRLPTELYLQIMEYLDYPTAMCLKLVNRSLYNSLTVHPDLIQLSDDAKAEVKAQVFGYDHCRSCMKRRPPGAFPHLVGMGPDETAVPEGWAGYFERAKRATENMARLDEQELQMKQCQEYYPSTTYVTSEAFNKQYGPSRGNNEGRQRDDAPHIWYYLPRGGFAGEHLRGTAYVDHFKYMGYCGWKCNGFGSTGWKWTWTCFCFRCSVVGSPTQKICCWCDQGDSRCIMLKQRRTCTKAILSSRIHPYGVETSWIATCGCERRGMPWHWGPEMFMQSLQER